MLPLIRASRGQKYALKVILEYLVHDREDFRGAKIIKF